MAACNYSFRYNSLPRLMVYGRIGGSVVWRSLMLVFILFVTFYFWLWNVKIMDFYFHRMTPSFKMEVKLGGTRTKSCSFCVVSFLWDAFIVFEFFVGFLWPKMQGKFILNTSLIKCARLEENFDVEATDTVGQHKMAKIIFLFFTVHNYESLLV